MVVRYELKIPSLGITVRHRSASLVMSNSYVRNGIFNPNLRTIKDSYSQIDTSHLPRYFNSFIILASIFIVNSHHARVCTASVRHIVSDFLVTSVCCKQAFFVPVVYMSEPPAGKRDFKTKSELCKRFYFSSSRHLFKHIDD